MILGMGEIRLCIYPDKYYDTITILMRSLYMCYNIANEFTIMKTQTQNGNFKIQTEILEMLKKGDNGL